MYDFESVRNNLTHQQQTLLTAIWRYQRQHNQWMPIRILHHDYGGKSVVLPLLEALGGAIVFERIDQGDVYYRLTLLGILLTEDAQESMELLVRYHAYMRRQYDNDPALKDIDSNELATQLGFDRQQLSLLEFLVREFNFSDGSGNFLTDGTWMVGIPDYVEDLPPNPADFVRNKAMSHYDPAMPISYAVRDPFRNALISKSFTNQAALPEAGNEKIPSVFIVHGHDEAMREKVAQFIQEIGYTPIVLHERPNLGRTIIEKFEQEAADIGFAIVLLSPDDFGAEMGQEASPRARQNVILELGYFVAKLGRERVCPLYKGDVELPSDIVGVLYIPFDTDGVWKLNLIREMTAVDMAAKTPPVLSTQAIEADKAVQVPLLPNLKIPKAEVEEKLKKQIETGREIARRRIRTKAGLEPALVTQSDWNSYNLELLTRFFDSAVLAEKYREVAFTPNVSYQRASLGKTIMRAEIERSNRLLTSILQRLELVPDHERQVGDIQIEKAEYGAGNAHLDVTDELRLAVKKGRLEMLVGDYIKGDPVKGVPKQLTVTYLYNGERHEKTAKQDDILVLP